MGIYEILILWKALSMWIGRVCKHFISVTEMVSEGYGWLNNR
jgi:hypothetical protein